MGATVTEAVIADLITGTQPARDKGKFYDMAQEFRSYVAVPTIFKKDKVLKSSGTSIEETLMTKYGTARNVGMDELDSFNILEHLKKLNIPWRRSTVNWTYGIEEMIQNKTPARITDVIKVRRLGARGGMANLQERNLFTAPTATDDDKTWWGIPYYLPAGTTKGFTSGLISGFTTKAGLDPVAVPRMNGYYGPYTNVTEDDFCDVAAEAMHRTGFESPIGLEDFRGPRGANFRLYTEYAIKRKLEKLAKASNDDVGPDIFKYDGITVLKGNGVYPIDMVEEYDLGIMFGVNAKTFFPAFLEGLFMLESAPEPIPYQHLWKVVHTDVTGNYVCLDPSRNFRMQRA